MESRCSRYDDDRVPDLRHKDLKREEKSVVGVPGCWKGTNLGFVLGLQIRRREEFGVDPLRQPGINLAPWCPNGKAEVEGPCVGEDDVPNDPPQEGIQEEEDEIHQIHDGQGESNLVSAENVTEVLVVTGVNLHAYHDIDGFSEGEGQEPIGFGELTTKDKEPEKNGGQPLFRCHGAVAGRESLAGEILP